MKSTRDNIHVNLLFSRITLNFRFDCRRVAVERNELCLIRVAYSWRVVFSEIIFKKVLKSETSVNYIKHLCVYNNSTYTSAVANTCRYMRIRVIRLLSWYKLKTKSD